MSTRTPTRTSTRTPTCIMCGPKANTTICYSIFSAFRGPDRTSTRESSEHPERRWRWCRSAIETRRSLATGADHWIYHPVERRKHRSEETPRRSPREPPNQSAPTRGVFDHRGVDLLWRSSASVVPNQCSRLPGLDARECRPGDLRAHAPPTWTPEGCGLCHSGWFADLVPRNHKNHRLCSGPHYIQSRNMIKPFDGLNHVKP